MKMLQSVHDLGLAVLFGGIASAVVAALTLFELAPTREVAGQVGQVIFERLGWVHDVTWAPVEEASPPSLSVHAYSPPLTAMSYYEVTDRKTLRRKRTELTDAPEG